MLAALGDTGQRGQEGHVRPEQHGAIVVADAGAHTGLGELGDALRRNRTRLAEAANGLRTGVVAAGSLAGPHNCAKRAPPGGQQTEELVLLCGARCSAGYSGAGEGVAGQPARF